MNRELSPEDAHFELDNQFASDTFIPPKNNEFSGEQIRAIGLAKKISALLIADLGAEIVEDYSTKDFSLEQIVYERAIKDRYELTSDDVALRAVWEVLHELLDEETRQEIGKRHQARAGKKVGPIMGQLMYQEKKGLFGRSEEKRIEDARKAGSLGGKKIREEKLGIFSYTTEQTRENSLKGVEALRRKKAGFFGLSPEKRRAAGHLAAEARGQFVWTDNEIEELKTHAMNQEYRTQRGGIDYVKIAADLNTKFQTNRTANAVEKILLKLKQSAPDSENAYSFPRGMYPWTDEEHSRLFVLAHQAENRTPRNVPNYKKLAEILNHEFGYNRTTNAIRDRIKKSEAPH